jgi:hypothetical protein
MQNDAPTQEQLPDFIRLWNFGDPAGTEKKFREILPRAESFGDPSYFLQLLTQIARTEGLQGNFNQAHRTLDYVENMLTPELRLASLRYLLNVEESSILRVIPIGRFHCLPMRMLSVPKLMK